MSRFNLAPLWSGAILGFMGLVLLPTLQAEGHNFGATYPQLGKSYQIVSKFSGKCIDVSPEAFGGGIQLQQSECSSIPSQKFRLLGTSVGIVTIVSQDSNQFIKTADLSATNGIPVIESKGSEGANTRIKLTPSQDGTFTLRFASTGKCLDVEGPSLLAGGKLHQWECLGERSQDWQFVEQTGGLGQQAWSLLRTNLFKDSFNRLFRQSSTESGLVISSVDEATGQDKWSQTFPSSFNTYPYCNGPKQFYVFGEGQLIAIDPTSGLRLWTYESADKSNVLFCTEGQRGLYLSSNQPDSTLTKVNRDTGEALWSQMLEGYASIQGAQASHVFVSVYKNDAVTMLALDGKNGSVKWTRSLQSSESLSLMGPASVFLQDGHSISKIDSDTGSTVWAYEGNGRGDGLYLDWNASPAIYARQGHELRRLSPLNGEVIWSISTPDTLDFSNSALITLKGGAVLMNTFDGAQDLNEATLFDADSKTVWTTTFKGPYGNPSLDKSGNLFFSSGSTLTSVDLAKGAVRWSYAHDGKAGQDHIYNFESFGGDVFLTYGGQPSRYPPMGIVRLDARTGALQWDVWVGESTTLIGTTKLLLLTNRVMGSGVISYRL